MVTAVGTDVAADLVGRRVLVDPALYLDGAEQAPPVGLLGSEADGGFAEYVAGSPLTDEQLACLPVAYGTPVSPGDTRSPTSTGAQRQFLQHSHVGKIVIT